MRPHLKMLAKAPKHLLAALAVVALLSGCSTVKGWFGGKSKEGEKPTEPAELVDFTASANVSKLWSTGVGKGEDLLGLRQVPAVLDGLKAEGMDDVPVIVGELGRYRPQHAVLNEVLARLPARVPRCAFVPSDGLVDKGDNLRFDSASLHDFGRRYARAWQALAAGRE